MDEIRACPSASCVIDALPVFKGLSEECFSFSLAPDFETRIENFKRIILRKKFYQLTTSFADQAIESVNAEFTPTWRR